MKKKICSLLLALLMVVTMLPVYQVSAVTKYNAGAALSYAKNHWNDGKGLCAEFVSDCLKAGGLSSWSTRCSALYRALYKEAVDGGIAKAYTLETNGRNYIRASSNSGKISNGDILFWYCSKCVSYDGNPYCHVAIVGGTDKDGDITVYQHNGAQNNTAAYVGNCYIHNVRYAEMRLIHFVEKTVPYSISFSPKSLTIDPSGKQTVNISFAGENIYTMSYGIANTNICAASWGEVNYSTGKTSLSITGKKPGTTNITVYLKDKAGNVLYSNYFTVTVNPYSAKLTSSTDNVKINLVQTTNSTINLVMSGNCPPKMQIKGNSYDSSIADFGWGSYTSGLTLPVIINAKKIGSTNIAFKLLDGETGLTVAEKVITVSVDAPSVVVSFNANGGVVNQTKQTVKYSLTYGSLPAPTREGYKFDGWYTASSGGTLITSQTKVSSTQDHTLYAHWTKVNIPVNSIKLNAEKINLFLSDTYNLIAQVMPATATNKTVNWSTSDASIASVTSNGLVTAHKAGTAVITATSADGTVKATCTVTVTDIAASGVAGTMSWALTANGKLIISGTGDMPDYGKTTAPWLDELAGQNHGIKVKSVEIQQGITSISEEAFFYCAELESITIPQSVKKIGDMAFIGCEKLTEITIPKGITQIGDYTFAYSGLKSIAIPYSVVEVKAGAFSGCSKLTSITIPSGVTEIGAQAFKNCSALKDVYFEGSRTRWNAIDIATEGNDPLRNATIHFSQPEPQPPVETSGTIAVSSVRARAGQTITVKVDLSANKGISNMRLQMSYPEGFTLERIQKGDALSTLFFTPPGKLAANPVNFVWDGTEADTSEGCILELTFRIADTVAVGEYSISLSYQKDDVLDGSLEGIDLALQNGTVSVVEFTRGDIDGDGVIGMKDLGALRKYFAGGYDAGNFVVEAADLDGDGVVTMKDLGVLRRYLAGGYDINLGE